MSGRPANLDNLPTLSRLDAIKQGQTIYTSQKSCLKHNQNLRYTSTSVCVICTREKVKIQSRYVENYLALRTPAGCIAQLLRNAKNRATTHNLEFNLTTEDLIWTPKCPLLGIELFVSSGKVGPNSPTLDRIDNSKGYISGNVRIISFKANTIKSNATREEIQTLLSNW